MQEVRSKNEFGSWTVAAGVEFGSLAAPWSTVAGRVTASLLLQLRIRLRVTVDFVAGVLPQTTTLRSLPKHSSCLSLRPLEC